jgi:hypothetical protein
VTERADRPWWASDGPVDGGVDRRVDAMEAVRAARRPRDATELPPWFETATDSLDPDGDEVEAGVAEPGQPRAELPPDGRTDPALAGETGHDPSVCGVCPICIALRTLQESRPELVRHLGEAARHLAAAARSLMDPAANDPAHPRERGGSATPGLRRIHLDAEGADDRAGRGAPVDDPEGPP